MKSVIEKPVMELSSSMVDAIQTALAIATNHTVAIDSALEISAILKLAEEAVSTIRAAYLYAANVEFESCVQMNELPYKCKYVDAKITQYAPKTTWIYSAPLLAADKELKAMLKKAQDDGSATKKPVKLDRTKNSTFAIELNKDENA